MKINDSKAKNGNGIMEILSSSAFACCLKQRSNLFTFDISSIIYSVDAVLCQEANLPQTTNSYAVYFKYKQYLQINQL